jgi:hypothetical protein
MPAALQRSWRRRRSESLRTTAAQTGLSVRRG